MRLRIYMRKRQLYNFAGNPVIYDDISGNTTKNPVNITAIPGIIPNNNWVDYTDSIANYDKLALSWSISHNTNGDVVNGSLQVQKGVSNTLQFERTSYEFLKSWLIDDVACKVNAVEVKIVDDDCGYYEGYQITSAQLQWCEVDNLCVYDVTLRQEDPLLQCLRSSEISDNWQGWFPKDGRFSGKFHPRFSYCVEQRPNALLVIGWFNLIGVGAIFTIVGTIVGTIYNIIAFLVNVFSFGTADIDYYDYGSIPNAMKQMLVESAGCGREHPAPLISDYIRNICDKCGIKYSPASIPIFFADTLTMTTSASEGQLQTFKNPYKYACYLDAPQKRGIRRFNGIDFFNNPTPNNSFWIPENAPLETLDMFLNKLKDVFNAEWRIVDGTLYFNRKDQFLDEAPVYDFSKYGTDRNKIIEGICYEPYFAQIGAYCRGLYTVDAVDTSGNESAQTNGLVSFGNVQNNPNYTASQPLDKTTQFSAARFRLDGGTTDYIMDALQVIVNGQFMQPWLVIAVRDVAGRLDQYANYALLMAAETTFSAKILLWDGASYPNARATGSANYSAPNQVQMVAIKTNTPYAQNDQVVQVNLKYPLEYDSNSLPVYKEFRDIHAPQTDVIGKGLSGNGGRQPGLYRVNDYGGAMIDEGVARLVNYPMYFAPQFIGGMWDRFHFIDDPRIKPQMNYNWSVKMPYCCEDADKLQITGDGMGVKLNTKVLLTTPFPGKITQITASLDGSNELGRYIELKGEC